MIKHLIKYLVLASFPVFLLSCNDDKDGPLFMTAESVNWITDMTVSQRTLEAVLYFRYDQDGTANSAQITTKNNPELFTAVPGRNGYIYTVANNIYVWTGGELEAYVYVGNRWEVEYRDEKPWRVTYLDNRTEDTLNTYILRFAEENIRALEVYDSKGEFESGYYWDSYDDRPNVFAGTWWIWHVQGLMEQNDVYPDEFPVAYFMENNPRGFRRIVNNRPDLSYEIEIGYTYDERDRTLVQNFNEESIPTIHRFEYNVENQ